MRAVDVVRLKRDGQPLPRQAIDAFVDGVTSGAWPDYQTSALLMAIVLRGMNAEETAWLTDAMVRSGERVDLSGLPAATVGKHSTGGVGDKVSIALAPVVAACGVIVPKMSGRGLGHTGGTLDKLEAIPGFRVRLSLDEFRDVLSDVGCAIISQTDAIAPADGRLYALRDVTGTVESIPLIASSIMSKKLAEGSRALVLDVKCGRGAFMRTRAKAEQLARALVGIGGAAGLPTHACITGMDTPLGRAVGNSLEIRECIDVLRGTGPADIEALVVQLAGRMLVLGHAASDDGGGETQARAALRSGRALERLQKMIERQGGDPAVVDHPERLPRASTSRELRVTASGTVQTIDAQLIGRAAMLLGAGRDRKDASIDPAAGIVLLAKPGDTLQAGDAWLRCEFGPAARTDEACALAERALTLAAPGEDRPAMPLVHGWIEGAPVGPEATSTASPLS